MTPQPIPKPLPDDDEDVHWALSTATALWARGEAQEALKWLRRAAETASDQNKDERALALYKAAADCTALLSARAPGVSPSAASAPAPVATSESQRPSSAALTPRSSVPPPLPPNRRGGGSRASIPSIPGPVSAMAPTAAAPAIHPPSPSGRPPPAPPVPPHRAAGGGGSDAASLVPVVPSGGKTMVSGSVRGPNVTGAKTLASNAGFEQALARAQASISMSREARAEEARVQQESRPPKSTRRSTTRNGRRSNPAIDQAPMTATPPTPKMTEAEAKAASQAAVHASGVASTPAPSEVVTNRVSQAPVKTKRFEDEITVEHERAPVVVRFDDLDEKTNVLANVPVPEDAPPSSTGRRRRTATDPAATRILTAKERDNIVQAVAAEQQAAERRTSSEPPPSGSRDLSRITSFRVALVADAERGTVEVMPLIPNEPSPTGLVTAILVPIDGTSSAQIAEILGRRKK
ncbi:MAG: hypothetical protein HOV80_11800 [Polyangiaceae bacterium]|nr:hypothetical protein [Polyangiaceae bacterium]